MSSRLFTVAPIIRRAFPFAAAALVVGLAAGVTTTAPAAATGTATSATATPNPNSLNAGQALAQAEQNAALVIATALTTPTSQTTANPNGTLTVTQSDAPVRTVHHGAWVGLNASLSRNADGTYAPAATTASVTLSGGGSGPLATLANSGQQLALTVPMDLPAPTVSSATATYSNVLPDVDLVVTIDQQGGFADAFVVRTAAAAANPLLATLHITTNSRSLTTTQDSNGALAIKDPAGHTAYTAPAPMMWDSATGSSGPTPGARPRAAPLDSTPVAPGGGAHEAPVGINANDTGITLTPNQPLLTAASTVFPVYIDPTLTPDAYGGPADWTEVESGKPTYAGWHQSGWEQEGDCGWDFCNGIGITRSYFQWGISPLFGSRVLSSQVNFTEEYSPACTLPAGRDGTVALEWTGPISSATTWNNQPSQITWTHLNDANMYGYSSACPVHGLGFDVTSEVISDVNGRSPTITLALFAEADGDPYGWKEFSDTATLTTNYDVTPATPTGQFTSPITPCRTVTPYPVIGNTDLYLYVRTPEASDNVAKPLSVQFNITNLSNGAVISQTTPATAGGGGNTIIARGRLTNGDYSWTAQSNDGLLASAWSPPCDIHVDTSQPGQPAISTPSQTGAGQSTAVLDQPIQFTFSPGAGSTPVAYQYQINGGAPVRVTATGGSWTGNIKSTTMYASVLNVQALSAAGTPSAAAASWLIDTLAPSPLPPDGDLTGDGYPDLLTVGGTGGTAPGLWQASGDHGGHLGSPINIGIRGDGLSSPAGQPADWTNALATHGQFTGDGTQNILAVFPSGIGAIYSAPGDGSALDPIPGETENNLTTSDENFHDPNDYPISTAIDGETIKQITAIGQLPEDQDTTTAFPDLMAVVNDNGQSQLWWFQHNPYLGGYQDAAVLDTNSVDWSKQTIAGTTAGGHPALAVRDNTTGAITLYKTNCTQNCDPNTIDWFTDATTATMESSPTTSTTASNAPNIAIADVNGDGQPDLWTVNGSGQAAFAAGIPANGSAPILSTLGAAGSAGTVIPPVSAGLVPLGGIRWQNPPPSALPPDHTRPPVSATTQTDLYATDSSGNLWDYQSQPSGLLGPAIKIGSGNWNNYTAFGVADWNGDGYPDLVLRNNTTCALDMFAGSATGFAPAPVQIGAGFCGYTSFGVEDWNHDKTFDILARQDSNGILWMYPGDLTGGGGTQVQIGAGFTAGTYDPFGVIDFNGDSFGDVLTRYDPSNILKLYRGDGAGGGWPNSGTQINTGFNGDTVVALIYYDGDPNKPELIVRQPANGQVVMYTGNGAGGWTNPTTPTIIANGW